MSDQRKYALAKIAAGDYLLPGNDGRTLYRIALYEEGPSHGVEEWPADRDVWGVWRWHKPLEPDAGGYVDTQDWDRWQMMRGVCATRAAAIEAALALEGWPA